MLNIMHFESVIRNRTFTNDVTAKIATKNNITFVVCLVALKALPVTRHVFGASAVIYPLIRFAQILDIPCEGACAFTDRWLLDKLAYGVPSNGPYQTNPPSPNDIILSILIDREGQVRRICHEEEIDVQEYQVLTRKIKPPLKPLEEIIQENVFCLGSENLEGIMAREEVVIPPPHLYLISLMMMMMIEIMKGPHVQVLLPPF
nr:cytochrome P450 [Tanacetum cinerariifolium]